MKCIKDMKLEIKSKKHSHHEGREGLEGEKHKLRLP